MTAFQRVQYGVIGFMLAALGPLRAGTPAAQRPNIILIVANDLGYGDLGCYGQKRIQTPNLDQLAAEGMRFTSFYAGAPTGGPSRRSWLTGLRAGHAGAPPLPLRAEDPIVSEWLKRAGYHNGMVGVWGLGEKGSPGVPQRKGFDEVVAYLDETQARDYYAEYLARYDDRRRRDTNSFFFENAGGKRGIYIPDVLAIAALNFVRINQPDRFNGFRPIFLYFPCTLPGANPEETRRSGNGMQAPNDAPYSAESWPQPKKNKAAMITRLDRDVGRLRSKLQELRMETNTVIFFTSANGPQKEGGNEPAFFQSSGPLRGIKGALHEGGIRVPLIVCWPGRIKPGQVNDQPWAAWDFLPTAAEIAQLNPPPNLDGVSMVPALLGQARTNAHEFLYWQSSEGGLRQAARAGAWKAVRQGANQPLELYNLETDLGEGHDVAGQNPQLVAEFEEYFKTARRPREGGASSPP